MRATRGSSRSELLESCGRAGPPSGSRRTPRRCELAARRTRAVGKTEAFDQRIDEVPRDVEMRRGRRDVPPPGHAVLLESREHEATMKVIGRLRERSLVAAPAF